MSRARRLAALLLLLACGESARDGADDGARVAPEPPPATAPPDAPELLLVTVDTWRWDHADWAGEHPAELTPNLAALAARGTVFERAYAPMNQTLPAHATLFTGLHPREHGALENHYRLAARLDTLAELLARAGWSTAAVVGAAVLHPVTGIAQGFGHWDLPEASELEQLAVPERPAREVVDAALDWWRANADGPPRFLWVHVYDPHAYYRPPEDALAQVPRAASDALLASRAERVASSVPPAALAALWHDYAGEVRAVDAALGPLLDAVRTGPRAGRTYVVVAGDHGEGLHEHGEATHELTLYEEQVRVPLLVAGPDVRAGGRVVTPVELADLRPTLERLVLRREPAPAAGRDLSEALRTGREPPPRPIFVERPHLAPERVRARSRGMPGGPLPGGLLVGVVLGDEKLVRRPDGALRLHDLARDPGELRNLAAERPERVEALRARLAEWLATRPAPAPGRGAVADEEHLARLRALGYIK